MGDQGKSGPGRLNIFFHNAIYRGGISFLFPGAKVTGYIHFHPSGHFQELGHPADRQKPNVDNCKRMIKSIYSDNPLFSSIQNFRAFGKQLSLINVL